MVSLVFFDILQLPHTVISNSEKLTHPIIFTKLTIVLYFEQLKKIACLEVTKGRCP